ncbi:hypothetical protein D9615_008115 [Tricholomella constricta]|uniref:Uncharacterized protein n=1 Tax=Tricholomella constricta TaxID=117010 RepID=A0A8H5GW07_9AGAR|nr:hypothetical protein D9615_008115 [Tricholomella constricta]
MFLLPDIVKNALSSSAEPTETPADGHYWYFPADIKQAILDQNTSKVRKAKQKHADDLKPNLDLMGKKGSDAYVTVTNESNKQQYQLCETDTGIMWTYTIDIQHIDAKVKATVAVGSFSKTAKILGISTTTLTNLPSQIADLTISTIAAKVVGTFVAQRLGGAIYTAALAAAETAATAGLEAAGVMVSELVVTIASFVTGLIAFIIVGLVVYFVLSAIHKSFGLQVNVYNWSTTEEWDIVEWYGDNADMQDTEKKSEPFKPANLPAVTNKITLPDKTTVTSDDLAASYATYTVVNDNNWMEGVGIGLKAVSNTTVIYMKYVIHWRVDNELNLGSAASAESLEKFYKGPWAKADTMSMKLELSASGSLGATPIIALTPALSGESSHMYSYDVHIDATAKQ